MTGESDNLGKDTYNKCLLRKSEFETSNDGPSSHSIPSFLLLSGTQIQIGEGFFLCIVVGPMTCEG
jgi:hypothetical protein